MKKLNLLTFANMSLPPKMPSSFIPKYYTYANFLSLSPASIDYSPYQPTPLVVMLLEESELREAKQYQFERFWRVWYTERETYAPKLQTLVLGLRIDADKGEGLKAFLEYFDTYVYPKSPAVGLQLYILNDEAELASAFRILP